MIKGSGALPRQAKAKRASCGCYSEIRIVVQRGTACPGPQALEHGCPLFMSSVCKLISNVFLFTTGILLYNYNGGLQIKVKAD